jgi:cation transport regulator ChaB
MKKEKEKERKREDQSQTRRVHSVALAAFLVDVS